MLLKIITKMKTIKNKRKIPDLNNYKDLYITENWLQDME